MIAKFCGLCLQVERATLEKEMSGLGLDMNNKDDVRTSLLSLFNCC